MRILSLCAFLCLFFHAAYSQAPSPWETVAPADSYIYTDLKLAIKDAAICYRIDLSTTDFSKDKKILPKVAALTNVMAMKMGNNNLSSIPSVFLNMHALVYFHSAGNPFTTLSDSIGMWNQLQYMELSGTHFDTLPEGLYGCTRLKSLSISSNKDTLHIQKGVAALSLLNELKIYSTPIAAFPDSVSSGFQSLHKLVLYKCGLKQIPASLLPMRQLHELWLDSNAIVSIPREITSMQGLTYLSLRGNKIRHVTSSMCFMQNLAVLDLTGNPIDPYEIHCLQALIPSCRIIF